MINRLINMADEMIDEMADEMRDEMNITPPSHEKKKIMQKIAKIRKTLDEQGKYAYYLITDDTVKLIAKGNNKEILDEEVHNKISQKDSIIGCFVYLVEVSIDDKYVANPSKIVVGPVHLKIKQFRISSKFSLVHTAKYQNGALFYTNNDIYNGYFRFADIKELIKKIHYKHIMITNMLGVRAVWVLEHQ